MFFKKKASVKETKEHLANVKQESEEEIGQYDVLREQAEQKIVELEQGRGDRIALLDAIGICYFKAKEYDLAQQYLEQSLDECKATKEGYRTLLSLYNLRRKTAAMNKDDEALQYYLRKIDEMMAISKEVLRAKL